MIMQSKYNRAMLGYTLIELMLVISIILLGTAAVFTASVKLMSSSEAPQVVEDLTQIRITINGLYANKEIYGPPVMMNDELKLQPSIKSLIKADGNLYTGFGAQLNVLAWPFSLLGGEPTYSAFLIQTVGQPIPADACTVIGSSLVNDWDYIQLNGVVVKNWNDLAIPTPTQITNACSAGARAYVQLAFGNY